MLFLHTSHQLEQLSTRFSHMISTPLRDVFAPETVVVQNAGMARYLSMQIADTSGISANMKYPFPAEFMWNLLRMVSPDIPEKSQCTPQTMRFHIMQELRQNATDYPELHHYISDQSNAIVDDNAVWALSCEFAQLFDQYLFYRSDWIAEWEDSPESFLEKNWQARLWNRCVKDKQLIHWLKLKDQFKDSLDSIDSDKLPERISFFSMSSLSPGYLELLGELSKKTDLHLFIMNPCENIYWGDISSEKTKSKLSLEEQDYSEVGNPILASMGKQGRDFIHQLLSLPETESVVEDIEIEAPNNHILKQLQNDILQLKLPTLIKDYSADKDHSIRFNACHTAMREVEVLHDQILDALQSDNSLAPSDIVVMMPDIEKYAPYIEAIFSNHTFSATKQKLPFSIADRNSLIEQDSIEALLKIMSLPETRFDVESVFELLDYKVIRTQFNLDESQINKCRSLAKATNIRWGISDKSRQKSDLPNTQEHTWKYALDRLLLGFAMGENLQGESLFISDNNDDKTAMPLLPFNDIEGSDALSLASLKQFTDAIFSISRWQEKNQTLGLWLNDLKEFLNTLLGDETDISKILIALNDLEGNANLATFEEALPFSVFQKVLQDCLQNISGSESYLGHGITFCALVPMRSVPFKVVALMGMNDGEFPRQDKHHSFDLMADKKRRGDRSRRDEDRYLFLESLLAARSRLIISYIGQSVKDNTQLPPSVLVSELIDALCDYSNTEPKDWISKHPLQAFNPRYFDESSDLFSYASEYTQLDTQQQTPSQHFITEPLEPLDDDFKKLTLSDLIQFFQSPARSFLKRRFAIQTFDDEVTLPVREPFELEFFKDRELRKLILDSRADSDLIARAKGLLPYGEIGDHIFNHEKEMIQNFKAQLPDYESIDTQEFSLKLGDFEIVGELKQLTETGRVVEELSQPFFREFIDLRLNHLVLNAIETKTSANYSYFHSPELSFSLEPLKDAQEQLSQLLQFYWDGLHFPAKFFPSSAVAMYKKGTENQKAAATKWHGDLFKTGEKDKFENWLLHRDVNLEDDMPEEFLIISQLLFAETFQGINLG